MRDYILFQDDFKGFGIGEFPFDRDHSATGEYHYVVEEGEHRGWTDQVCNYTYNGMGPSWIITEDQGTYYMESCRIEKGKPHRMFPTLQTGICQWRDYDVSVKMRRLSTKGMAGLAFCMNDSIDTLVFSLENGDKARLSYRHKEDVLILKEAEYRSDCDSVCLVRVSVDGGMVRCYVDEQLVIEAGAAVGSGGEQPLGLMAENGDGQLVDLMAGNSDEQLVDLMAENSDGQLVDLLRRGGKVALTADCPTQFTDFVVCTEAETARAIQEKVREKEARERQLQASYPGMKVWKKMNLKDFGTSRQIRFGHLTGTKEWYLVIPQAQKRVAGDAYAHISCITAVNLDGEILWQKGVPSANSKVLGKISADLPIQVYDIDGDGVDEVIIGHNFEIQILDGRTGEVKKSARTPYSEEDDADVIDVPYHIYAFDRINPDGIRIANFRGLDRPSDILIKDRYCRVYALDSDLNLMWRYHSPKNTGHFPLAVDVNGDGHDELLCGYTLLDCHGKPIWTYPIEKDHTDEIVAGRFMAGSDKGYFACVSGTQGFFIGDFQGNILVRDRIGHAQRVSVANYCPEREGFEIAVSNFWGHQGVIYFYDCFGNQLWEMENEMNGNLLAPVNWLGNGQDFILTNAEPRRGGLLNGNGERAVAFPDDGHPMMCCEAIDLCGDDRDELVVWDYENLWIYTQDDGVKETTYHPAKYPFYNASNYRGEFSFPDESFVRFSEPATGE